MDEGKKIKMHLTSDKEKEAKAKKEKGQEHLESEDLHKKEKTTEALSPETSEERKNEDLASLLKAKEEELQKEHDRLLRTLAEHENYKKRMARERTDFLKFGNESLIKELLPVLDNLSFHWNMHGTHKRRCNY